MLILFAIMNVMKLAIFDHILSFSTTSFKGSIYGLTLTMVLVTCLILLVVDRFRSRVIILTGLYAVQLTYLLANLTYFNYFHGYPTFSMLSQLFFEAGQLARNFAIPLDRNLLYMLIDLPFLVMLARRKQFTDFHMGKATWIAITGMIAGITTLGSVYLVYDSPLDMYKHDGYPSIVKYYGLITLQAITHFEQGGNDFHYGPSQRIAPHASKDKPNILLIQVESMDADILRASYKNKPIMPFAAQLSRSNIYYPFTMSYHLGGASSDCEFSIFNSVEPLLDKAALKLLDYDFNNSFINILKRNHYSTLSFHGNTGNFYNRNIAYPRMGFDSFCDLGCLHVEEKGWGASDQDVFDVVANKLRYAKSPFLIQVITMSSHEPFTSVRMYYNNTGYDDIEANSTRNYFNAMSYVDRSLEAFLRKIDLSNTYVFIYGDHAVGIAATPYFKPARYSYQNRYFEFVPLIIITPDKKQYVEKDQATSFFDIAPTILTAADVTCDIRSNGENLLRHTAKRTTAIPFQGRAYARDELFRHIEDEVQ